MNGKSIKNNLSNERYNETLNKFFKICNVFNKKKQMQMFRTETKNKEKLETIKENAGILKNIYFKFV